LIAQKLLDKVNVFCDGAARGNPGSAAIAYIIKDEKGTILKQESRCIGECSNNTAEYKAIIEGLKACSSFTRQEVTVFSDSQLAIKQINGIWRINYEHLRELYQEVRRTETVFKKVTYIHKLRTNHDLREVDRLVNEVLDS